MKAGLLISLVIVSAFHCFGQFQFISPMPGATRLPVQHNIIIREGTRLLFADSQLFSIFGIKSGNVAFNMVICDDQKTLNLNPLQPFAANDTITVIIAAGAVTVENAGANPDFQFTFTTASEAKLGERKAPAWWEDEGEGPNETVQTEVLTTRDEDTAKLFSITTNLQPSSGDIFFDCNPANSQLVDSALHLIAVIKNNGDSVYQQTFTSISYNFHLGSNGYFISYRSDSGCFNLLDSNFHVVDSYSIANGFIPDPHDCQVTADGYAFIIGIEDQSSGGEMSPVYRGSVIQQFDTHHNIIFEWRSMDHIGASETTHLNGDGTMLDYVHTNSIEIDVDGNIIMSNRNLDQVNKIDISTGAFIWRLGGVKNEFTFLNDPETFSRQHDCRRLPNGNITLYDNGNYHPLSHSAAKEYRLDEVNKTATLVWSYKRPLVDGVIPYYVAMGNVQRLPNGNTFINWGKRSQTNLPSMTEVDSAGTIVWEMKLAADKQYIAYRAHKYEWNPCARPSADSMKVEKITGNSARLSWDPVANANQQYEVHYKRREATAWETQTVISPADHLVLYSLQPSTTYDWQVKSWCDTVATIASGFSETRSFTTTSDADKLSLLLYPNPAQEQVIIQSPGVETVRLFNLQGQQLLQVDREASDASEMVVSIASLPSGLYLVVVGNADYRAAAMLSVVK
ncbi:MAG TPA: aryl-sulfate sulfotransferase [Chitinophagales bacterium]|nr:aryl-sulfate sulfotransferase [Chitinophagales bacterium]